MRKYEAMTLVNSSVLREDSEQIQAVRDLLEKQGAEILSCEKWDERKLCYELKGQKRAAYILTYFNADPQSIKTVNQESELAENILRIMTLNYDPNMESLSAKEQAREKARSDSLGDEDGDEGQDDNESAEKSGAEAETASGKKKRRYRRFSDRRRCRFTREGIGKIDYKDVPTLKKLCTSQGKLYSRKRSGNSAFHQRSAKKAIKRARYLALMPYVGAI